MSVVFFRPQKLPLACMGVPEPQKTTLVITSSLSSKLNQFTKRKLFSINWSFRHTLFLFMIVFGCYGWGTANGINNLLDASNVLTCLLVLLSSMFLYKRRMDFNSHFQKPISIELGMVLTVLGFTLLGTIINYASKSRSLTVDELSYAWLSQLHSYVLSSRLFEYLPLGLLTINSRFLVQFLALIFFWINPV